MNKTYNIYHLVFIIILTIHYSLSLILFDGIIFGQETDVFEAELLFNKILGDIYKQDYYILNSLLGGVYEWYYFTRALFVINYIYVCTILLYKDRLELYYGKNNSAQNNWQNK